MALRVPESSSHSNSWVRNTSSAQVLGTQVVGAKLVVALLWGWFPTLTADVQKGEGNALEESLSVLNMAQTNNCPACCCETKYTKCDSVTLARQCVVQYGRS